MAASSSKMVNNSAVTDAIATLSPGGEWLAGFSHGYPVYSSYLETLGLDMNQLYNVNANTTLATNRIIGEKSNLLLGGVLLHQKRKPLSTVYTSATGTDACNSQFANLKTTCISSNAYSLTSKDGGWFGRDPVFYNRSTLYNPNIDSEKTIYAHFDLKTLD